MELDGSRVNLVLSGGGIKGIAYVGAFSVLEARGINISNIVGVSAGALAGAYIGAGYKAAELKHIMETFEFSEINLHQLEDAVPVLSRYRNFLEETRFEGKGGIYYFLAGNRSDYASETSGELDGVRGNILKSIITYTKEGCLLNGDYLEEWVSKTLQDRGIRTFADFRGGLADKQNPRGYKVRMTAVDATRNKVLVLPDDIEFYGINPDDLPVAKAVRMSTCVPFAFKPVELEVKEGGISKTYSIVDGGIFDNFPFWLIDSKKFSHTLGFRLDGGSKKKLISLNTPVDLYKKLVSSIQDLGIPKTKYKLKNVAVINTGKVSFLDFNIGAKEKDYLYLAGRKAAMALLLRITRQAGDSRLKYAGAASIICALLKRALAGFTSVK